MAFLKSALLLLLLQVFKSSANEGELQQVTVIHRHGARAPLRTYKADPYANKPVWPNGLGQLTNEGKAQAYELGTFLRKRYNNFFSEHFFPTNAYFRSTNTTRTLMTAQLVGVGLFPASGLQNWTNQSGLYSWTPIPVSSLPVMQDTLLKTYSVPCPAAKRAFEDFQQSAEFKDYAKKYDPLLKNLTNFIQQTVTIHNFTRVYDVIHSELCNGLKALQPSWINNKIMNNLWECRNKLATFRAPTRILKRLYGGTIVKKIIDNSHNRIGNSSQMKLYDYSTHDKMLSVILSTLGIHNGIQPPFSAAIILELRSKKTHHGKKSKSDSDYFLNISYRNDSNVDPYPMKIPGCKSDPCTLEEFVQATSDIIPEDYVDECDNKSSSADLPQISKFVLIFAFFIKTVIVKC